MPEIALTPEQCAKQFRLYAQTHPSSASKHSLNFCADFLDEFCVSTAELKDLRAAMALVLCTEAHIEKRGGPQGPVEDALIALSGSFRQKGWVCQPGAPAKVVKLTKEENHEPE